MRWLLWLLLSSAVLAQTLKALDGRSVSLEELRKSGRPLLLMTWCSHCSCCRSGEGQLLALSQRYPQLQVRALDAQWGDDAAQVRTYLKKKNLELPVLFDPRGQLCQGLGIRTSTTALLWDARGQMRYFGNLQQLPKAVQQLTQNQLVSPSSTPQQGCAILFSNHR